MTPEQKYRVWLLGLFMAFTIALTLVLSSIGSC